MRSSLHAVRSALAGAVVTAGLVAFGTIGALGAQAAPLNCAGPEAPPQCHHLPPAPPPALRSAAFTPIPDVNNFDVIVFADPAAVAGYGPNELTRYRVWLECSNGYTHLFSLVTGHNPGTLVADDLTTSAGQAAGTCDFVTWDQGALSLTRADPVEFVTGPALPFSSEWSETLH